MRKLFRLFGVALLVEVALSAQGQDASKILSASREALGGDTKLAAVKTLIATGRSSRVTQNGSVANDFELALELPDRFFKKDTVAMINGSAITHTSGFNGANLIEVMDTPPQMGGGVFIMRRPGDAPPGVTLTAKSRRLACQAFDASHTR